MEFDRFKKKIQNAFKLSGFTIKSDLCLTILENWNEDTFTELNDWIDKIIDSIQNQSLSHSNLTEKDIEIAIQNSRSTGLENTETVISVIGAYDVPKFIYNIDRKKFLKDTTTTNEYFPPANAKADLFSYRYTMVLQRVLRNELFKPSILGDNRDTVQLLTVESLLSTGVKRNHAIVLGLLTQISEGKWYLEDPTGILQLDLSKTRYHTGLYTENCIVLCDGTFEDKILQVEGMAHPPIESSIDSREYFGDVNTFGGISKTSLKYSKHLLSLEKENRNGIIFMSDIWLDQDEVIQKLKIFFEGFSTVPPIAFVFLGNFLSGDKGSERAYELKTLLKNLSEIIAEYPNLVKNSSFIFVPGRYDPTAANILPRPPLPEFVTEEFRKKIPKSTFTTNPCRIQYCTQEIIVIREDLLTKMFRNTIYFPDKNDNVTEHFTKTILGQGHLSPFTLNVLPTYWSYDYTLSLYPIPDVLVIGDQFKSFSQNYQSCDVINPGPFSKNEFSFKVYYPSTREIDDSCIPTDM